MNKFKTRTAESLIETMVAITVIVIIFTAAMTLNRVSLHGNQSLGNRLSASDRAEDGLNALINIRDTNYLRFASDPDNCWDKYNISDVADCSDGTADEIQEGVTYYLSQNFSSSPYGAWQIETVSSDDDGWITLYNVNLDADPVTTEAELYLQSKITSSAFTEQEGGEDLFRRTFTVAYNVEETAYAATITVIWAEFGLDRSITRTRTIENIF